MCQAVAPCLFDLNRDPCERRNSAATEPAVQGPTLHYLVLLLNVLRCNLCRTVSPKLPQSSAFIGFGKAWNQVLTRECIVQVLARLLSRLAELNATAVPCLNNPATNMDAWCVHLYLL